MIGDLLDRSILIMEKLSFQNIFFSLTFLISVNLLFLFKTCIVLF